MKPLMECGHAANSTLRKEDGSGVDACAICLCSEPAETQPNLEGRRARCSYFRTCKGEVDSKLSLAFFAHHPDKPFDGYYCGCYGWD